MFNCCSNKLHITDITYTCHNIEHNETIAQMLQPQAASFKSLIEMGTNQFLKQWSLQWRTLVSSAARQELIFWVEYMWWVDQYPLRLFRCGLRGLVFLPTHHLHGSAGRVNLVLAYTIRVPHHVDIPYLTRLSISAWLPAGLINVCVMYDCRAAL